MARLLPCARDFAAAEAHTGLQTDMLGNLRCAAFVALTSLRAMAAFSPEVSLYVTVRQDGKFIDGLGAAHFQLFEDGESRPFRLAKPEKPVTLALLIEYSRSSWHYLESIQRALRRLVSWVPEGSQLSLATFASQSEVAVEFNPEKRTLLAALHRPAQPRWDYVDTYEAVCAVLEKMGRQGGRRVLVFIGAGANSFSAHSRAETERRTGSVNATIFTIGLTSLLERHYEYSLGSPSASGLGEAEAFLRALAEQSGGRAWLVKSAGELPGVIRAIARTIEHQYRLVYTPRIPVDHRFHNLEIRAHSSDSGRRINYQVLARRRWWSGSGILSNLE